MTEPDNAHDAAVERVFKALIPYLPDEMPDTDIRKLAAIAIAAYKQGVVTDEKLWAEYKAGKAEDVPAQPSTISYCWRCGIHTEHKGLSAMESPACFKCGTSPNVPRPSVYGAVAK